MIKGRFGQPCADGAVFFAILQECQIAIIQSGSLHAWENWGVSLVFPSFPKLHVEQTAAHRLRYAPPVRLEPLSKRKEHWLVMGATDEIREQTGCHSCDLLAGSFCDLRTPLPQNLGTAAQPVSVFSVNDACLPEHISRI